MKKITLFILVLSVLSTILGFSVLSSTGITFYSGSPADGGNTCSGCHMGGSTAPTASLVATPAFGAGDTYVAGATYTLTVACSGTPKFGLCLEILNSNTSSGTDAGTFGSVVTSNCKKMVSSGNPTNIVHTAPSGTANQTAFSFVWTAPATGKVYIYYCVNGVNGNTTTSGDKAQAFSMVLTGESSVPSIDQNKFHASIFPNPAHDFITLNYLLKESSNVKAELINMEGKTIAAYDYNRKSVGEYSEIINLAELNLTSGIYSIRFKTNTGTLSKKLIIK